MVIRSCLAMVQGFLWSWCECSSGHVEGWGWWAWNGEWWHRGMRQVLLPPPTASLQKFPWQGFVL